MTRRTWCCSISVFRTCWARMWRCGLRDEALRAPAAPSGCSRHPGHPDRGAATLTLTAYDARMVLTPPPVPPDGNLRVGDIVELVTSVVATRGVVNTLLKDGVNASVQWDNGSGPVL